MRRSILFIGVLALLAWPAEASTPAGLAGRLDTGMDSYGFSCAPSLEWYEYWGEHPMAATDTLVFDASIIPFDRGMTLLALDEIGGGTFFGLTFEEGKVNGLDYEPDAWNDVRAEIRPGSQDFILTVNGVNGGPFPLAEFCPPQGGCHSAQAFRAHSFEASAAATAWLDSISLTLERADGSSETLLSVTFDDGATYRGSPGTITATEPPDPEDEQLRDDESLRHLLGEIEGMELRPGVRASLDRPLAGALLAATQAEAKIARSLLVFVRQVESQIGRGLSEDEAAALISRARVLLEAMGQPFGQVSRPRN